MCINMTREDFEILKKVDLNEYITSDPIKLAFKGVDKAICTQVKYLQKAKHKLPHYYDSRCIIAELSFEQSSSLYTSEAKKYNGERCIDMTCGIGSDTLHFSKNFKYVTTIERDELFADIARYNFSKLNADNVIIHCCDSLDYVKSYDGEIVDMVFIDPARRSDKKRVFLFEECSPNVFEVLKYVSKITKRFVIKASPLYDVEQARRDFEGYGRVIIETVSYNNECKELVVDIEFSDDKTVVFRNTIISKSGNITSVDIEILDVHFKKANIEQKKYCYLYIADVAFYKSRTLHSYIAINYPEIDLTAKEGVGLGEFLHSGFLGKVYRIESSMEYKPKIIKKYLKQNGIKTATILKKGGVFTVNEIMNSLALKEGCDVTIIEVAGSLFFLRLVVL